MRNNVRLNTWNHILSFYGLFFISIVPVFHALLLLPVWWVLKRQPQNAQALRKLRNRVDLVGGWALHDVNLLGLVVMIMEIGHIGRNLAKELTINVRSREGVYLMGVALILECFCLWYTRRICDAHATASPADDFESPDD